MKVLVACEESQRVTIAFREHGHEAYSCDIQPCSGGHPEWHIQGDALELLGYKWDLIIAHPPCTYLSKVGSMLLFNSDHSIKSEERLKRGFEAKEFFMKFYNADCPRICVENPTPIKIFGLPKPDCIINPCDFGDPYLKRTCLWLKGLPPLFSTSIFPESMVTSCVKSRWFMNGTGAYRQRNRSKTFPGIAKAMAEQWGDLS